MTFFFAELMLLASVIFVFTTDFYGQAGESRHTKLGGINCKVVETDLEYERRRYNGIEGYRLDVADSDERESVTVLSPNGRKSNLQFDNPGGNFSYVGENAVRRAKKQGKSSVAYASIIRFNIQEDNEHQQKQRS